MNKDHTYWVDRVKRLGERSVRDIDSKKGAYDTALRKYVFLKTIKLRSGMKILDAGCGTGDWCIDYAKAGCGVTGIDFMDDLIQLARVNAQKASLNIQFINQNLESYTSNHEYFDLVTSVTVLQHITDDERFKKSISNIFKLLKPGGMAAITEYMPYRVTSSARDVDYMRCRPKSEWVQCFEEAGFKLTEEKSVRILGFKLYNIFKFDFILKLSLHIDKLLISCDPLFKKYADTRLLVFRK